MRKGPKGPFLLTNIYSLTTRASPPATSDLEGLVSHCTDCSLSKWRLREINSTAQLNWLEQHRQIDVDKVRYGKCQTDNKVFVVGSNHNVSPLLQLHYIARTLGRQPKNL